MDAPEHWIFAYGSLMWRPGFRYAEARRAELTGFRRCFCVYSVHHRGTRARPGLVLGLDRGGACTGVAFRIHPEDASEIEGYLRAREQVEGVYRAVHAPIELTEERREVLALAFIVERSHVNYAGRLSVPAQARIIAAARGISGVNADYLFNTLGHLAEMGLRERELERIGALVGPFVARPGQGDDAHARPAAKALQRAMAMRPPPAPPRPPKEPSRRFLFRRQDRFG
jgi:cation transport protein ChaC